MVDKEGEKFISKEFFIKKEKGISGQGGCFCELDKEGNINNINEAFREFIKLTGNKFDENSTVSECMPIVMVEELEKFQNKGDFSLSYSFFDEQHKEYNYLFLFNKKVENWIVTGLDITETINRAHKDTLTGLNNRYFGFEFLNKTNPNKETVAILIYDLDGLKEVNDSLGHGAGDLFIRQFGKIIQGGKRESEESVLKEEDLGCRFGGDEFFVILSNLSDSVNREGKTVTIKDQVKMINDRIVEKAKSFGISVSSGFATSLDSEEIVPEIRDGKELIFSEIKNETLRKIFILADSKMYTNKKSKRKNEPDSLEFEFDFDSLEKTKKAGDEPRLS